MPLPRTLSDRVQKYTAKYSPDVIKARLTQVQGIAETRYTEAVPYFVTIRELTRNIVESAGVPAGVHAVYYSFAFRVASVAQKHHGETLDQMIQGLKAEWTTIHGADPAILDKIISLVKGAQ